MKIRRNNLKGFTLIELLVVIAIIGVLASLTVPAARHFKKKAEIAACLGNMRNIHGALGGHLLDKGYWPQLPMLEEGISESDYFEFWIKSLEPYGVAEQMWLCPSDKVQADRDPDDRVGSYLPTAFDAFAITPHRWNQPWLVERGDLHGKGAHIAMPDGSISPSRDPFGGIN